NTGTRKVVHVLRGHAGGVNSIIFCGDGKQLVSGGSDARIKIWNIVTGQEVNSLTGHTDAVTDIAVSPDELLLASASVDHTVRMWDFRTGREQRTIERHSYGVTSVAFSPDGRWIASGSGEMFSGDSTALAEVKVWNAATGEERWSFRGHTNFVTGV